MEFHVNHPLLFVLAGLLVAVVLGQSVYFLVKALKRSKELGMDSAKVNSNGGAMALGHPLGATGAILSCKALAELSRTGGRYALVTMCIAGGMGAAGVFKAE